MDGEYWKGDRTMSTNEWLLTSDFWQFLEPWHGRWYEYEIFIASCTDNIYDLENERWLLGDMIDHVGIYGSREAGGLSAFKVSLVYLSETIGVQPASTWWLTLDFTSFCGFLPYQTHLACRNFICQHSVIAQTTVKQRPLAFILFKFQCWDSPAFHLSELFSARKTPAPSHQVVTVPHPN